MIFIEGTYLDGKTSKRHPARLEVNTNHKISHIHLLESQQSLSFEQQHYVIESRLGNTPREISFDDNQLFTCENHDEIDRINTWHPDKQATNSSWLHNIEGNVKLICLSTITTALLLYGIIVYGIPSTAKLMAHHAPHFSSQQLVSSLDILDKTVFDPSELSPERQQEILALAAPYLAEHADIAPQLKFRSGMKANALALPSGIIVFTDDFVNLTQSNDELVAVLFHELGHLTHKHMTQRMIQDAMLTIFIIFITGDVETFDLVTGLPTLLLDLAYSREFEIEADSYAFSLLKKHSIPLTSFADAMTNLENYYRDDSEDNHSDSAVEVKSKSHKSLSDFFSTHPNTQERINRAKQLSEE